MNYDKLLSDYLNFTKERNDIVVDNWDIREDLIGVNWSYSDEDSNYSGLCFIPLFDLLTFVYSKI